MRRVPTASRARERARRATPPQPPAPPSPRAPGCRRRAPPRGLRRPPRASRGGPGAGAPGARGFRGAGPPVLLAFLSEPRRRLSQMSEPPLPITFDVNHPPPRSRVLSADDPIHDVLEGIESLAPPADEEAAAVGAHREQYAPPVLSGPRLDNARDAKAREDGLERVLALELERRRRRRRVRRCLWWRLGERVSNLSVRRFVVLHWRQGFPGIHVGRFGLQTMEPGEQGRAHRCPDAGLLPPEPE